MKPSLITALVLIAGMVLGVGPIPGVDIAIGAGAVAKRWVERERAEREMQKTVEDVRAGKNPHIVGIIDDCFPVGPAPTAVPSP